MNVKNINPVERHIEKITLAVAAAAALFLAYSAFAKPIVVSDPSDGGKPVRPGDVAAKISAAVADLHRKIAIADNLPDYPRAPTGVSSIAQQWLARQAKPLPRELLAQAPKFAPDHIAGAGVIPGPDNPIVRLATPIVPPLDNATLDQGRGVVIVNDPPKGVTVPPTWSPKTEEWTWVKISAFYNMLQLEQNLAGVGLPPEKVLPRENQHLTVVRVEAEKRVKNADGTWGPWLPVAPLPTQTAFDSDPLPSDPLALQKQLNNIDDHLLDILQPPLPRTQNAGPTIVPTPLTPKVLSPAEKFKAAAAIDAINAAHAAADAAARDRAAKFGGPGPINRNPADFPSGAYIPPNRNPADFPSGAYIPPNRNPADVLPAPFVPPPGSPPNQPLAVIQQNPAVPLVVYDKDVQAERDYQYRVRLKIYNPLYHFQKQVKLDEEAKRNEPYLTSAWVDATPSFIHIQPNQFFWLASGLHASDVAVRIYRWQDGRWIHIEDSITPGSPVGHPWVIAGAGAVDFSTSYVVVDIHPDPAHNNTSVVFLNTVNGQLITRDLNSDSSDPLRLNLDRGPVAPASGGTGGTGGTGAPAPGGIGAAVGPGPALP